MKTYKKLIVGITLISLSFILQMYQMLLIKETTFGLYVVTLILCFVGIYIGGTNE